MSVHSPLARERKEGNGIDTAHQMLIVIVDMLKIFNSDDDVAGCNVMSESCVFRAVVFVV